MQRFIAYSKGRFTGLHPRETIQRVYTNIRSASGGCELPANSAHKFVYDAVLRRIFAGVDFKLMASNAQ